MGITTILIRFIRPARDSGKVDQRSKSLSVFSTSGRKFGLNMPDIESVMSTPRYRELLSAHLNGATEWGTCLDNELIGNRSLL